MLVEGSSPTLTCQVSLLVHVSESTEAVNGERHRLDRGLEALQTTPRHIPDKFQSVFFDKHRQARSVLDSNASALGHENEILQHCQPFTLCIFKLAYLKSMDNDGPL